MTKSLWLKRGLAFTAAALAIHSCRPITSCGCTPPLPELQVNGGVTTAAGGAAPGVAVEATVFGPACGADPQFAPVATTTGGSGSYALTVRQPPLPSFCLRVVASTPAGSVAASRDTTLSGADVAAPSVVRVDLVLP